MWLTHPNAVAAFHEAQHDLDLLDQQNFAPELVDTIRTRKLARLWGRAVTTPYYAHLAKTTPDQLIALPATPKSVVKAWPQLFVSVAGRRPFKYYETSGTTGTPTASPRLVEDVIWNVVSVASLWKRFLSADDRAAILLPSDVAPVGDLVSNVCEYLGIGLVRCYPFAVGVCDWDRLEHIFTHYQPTCIFAAPGVLLQWMRLLKQRGTFDRVRASVTKVLLLGEVSTLALRQMLALNWQAHIYDASYGSTETGTIAATCEGQQLHVLAPGFVLEIQQHDQIMPCLPGTQGELLVTTLNNYARPLLRYATGDLVDVSAGALCSCGLPMPILRVLGRKEDQIQVRGAAVDVELIERIVYSMPGITGYLIEVRDNGSKARLLLEKDIDFAQGAEEHLDLLEQQFAALGLTWDSVVLLNQLPAMTKSGAGQKNWKKTNIRVVA